MLISGSEEGRIRQTSEETVIQGLRVEGTLVERSRYEKTLVEG